MLIGKIIKIVHPYGINVVHLPIFRLSVPCCDIRYDVCKEKMLGSSLLPYACRKAHVLFVFLLCFSSF